MTNTTKVGSKQTASRRDASHFDEAAYRDELIALGLPAEDAAVVATKTANARRDALSANEYRLGLIASGVGEAEAKRLAEGAARFLKTPEPKTAAPQRVEGFQPLGGILGATLNGAKKPGLPASVLTRSEEIRAKRRKLVEDQARPGETFEQAERRFLEESDRPAGAAGDADQKPPSAGSLRKPPEGDGQGDFFIPTLFDIATKDTRSIMDVAVFRLSKKDKRANETIRYERSDGYVEVVSGPAGMASVWDFDIVLMAISHLTEAVNRHKQGRSEKPSRIFRPHVSEILKFCRRSDGGRQYEEIEAALDRLKTTSLKIVRTTSVRGGRPMRVAEGEGLISNYRTVSYADNGRVASVEIEVPNWIYREVVEAKNPQVLTVHPSFFLIEPGIGRFLYRLARRAAGETRAKWSFRTIYERSGSTGTFKKFTFTLRGLIASNDLPEYLLAEVPGQSGPQLVMTHRDAGPLPDLADDTAEGDMPGQDEA